MIIIEREFKRSHLVQEEALSGMTFTGEDGGHKFIVHVKSPAGEAETLTGSVVGKFVRADGVTVELTATEDYAGIENGAAWVILAANCYTQAGPFRLTVTNIASDETRNTVCAFTGYVRTSETDEIVDPENVINVDAIVGMIDEMEDATEAAQEAASFVNSIIAPSYSTSLMYAVGDYCTYNGAMYRCTTATDGAFNPNHWQAVKVGSEFQNVDGQIDDLKSAIGEVVLGSIEWTAQNYINGSTGETAGNASYSYAIIPIAAVPVIKVTTKCLKPAGICFYDSNDVFISGINGTSSTDMTEYSISVPGNAAKIGISCISGDKNDVVINAVAIEQIVDLNNHKQGLPFYLAPQQLTLNQGIVNKNTTIYNPTEDYAGRYVSAHFNAGTEIFVTGYANNSTYPALVLKYDDNTTASALSTTATSFVDSPFVMPKDGTAYVSGNNVTMPVIKLKAWIGSDEGSVLLLGDYFNRDFSLKAKVTVDGKVYIKKRISDTESLGISFAHNGGNSLFNFAYLFKIAESSGEPTTDSFTASGNMVSIGSTDWFSPYLVQAVNNADGDVPAGNDYMTGGNHRSNNTATGGGVTAVEDSWSISIGGVVPLRETVYNTDDIVIKWTNLVQGNNTSKADGSGRAIISETWTLHICPDGIVAENDICPLESVTIRKYYGLQAFFSGGSIIYKGGTTRTPVAINSISNSGNTDCREAVIYDSNYKFGVYVEPLDLGLFKEVAYSLFTTNASKMYCNLIETAISAAQNEHYYIKGAYKFW